MFKRNCKQIIKLRKDFIELKSYSRLIHDPFRICPDFECISKRVKSNKKTSASRTENYQDQIPCSFAYQVLFVDDIFSKPVVLYSGKYADYNFTKSILTKNLS